MDDHGWCVLEKVGHWNTTIFEKYPPEILGHQRCSVKMTRIQFRNEFGMLNMLIQSFCDWMKSRGVVDMSLACPRLYFSAVCTGLFASSAASPQILAISFAAEAHVPPRVYGLQDIGTFSKYRTHRTHRLFWPPGDLRVDAQSGYGWSHSFDSQAGMLWRVDLVVWCRIGPVFLLFSS